MFTNFGDICTLVNKYWALLQISNCSLFNLVTPHNKSYGGITIIAELKYSISKPWRKGFNLNWLTLTNVKIRANQRNKTVDANGFSLIFNYRRIHLFQIAFNSFLTKAETFISEEFSSSPCFQNNDLSSYVDKLGSFLSWAFQYPSLCWF